ncbi:hypothetical protein B0H11DRAFT_2317756 [Mycena galericulata]|nr:hypothetical protein B0H11DRAFT_2317756 [Mycena galericulata]
MRSLLLWWILWVVSFGFFTQMRSPSSPSETSSLAHRNERRIRQARIHANLAPYRSPPRLYAGLPLHDVGNAPSARPVGDLESHRAAHRGADREQQLALQDTPSRRRRRIPANRTDENRAPSPTPAVRRHIAQASNDGRNVNTRLRQLHKYPSLSSRTHPKTVAKRGNEGGVNVNDENQQQLRVEREQHEQAGQGRNHDNQLLTPPATHRREQAIGQNLEMVLNCNTPPPLHLIVLRLQL